MKKLYTYLLFAVVFFSQFTFNVFAQCTTAKVNWDNLDFLVLSGSYTPFVTNSLVQNQNFAIGKNRMTFVHDYSSTNSLSENTSHTGETGTFGAGADVQFIGNGTITFNFATAVQNLQFSLYDIDYGQRAAFSAFNVATAINVNLATLTGTILTITNNNSTTARVDAAATTSAANTSTAGAVNVTVAGPVTSITITLSNTGTKTNGPAADREDGSFWVSDISACVTGTFPTNYYNVSRPFTGQPGYVLTVVDNKVYYTNPADGVSKLLFTDPGHTNINSLAYDPYNRIVYYTYSLTATPQNEKTIRKYNVNTGTISVLNNDIYSNLNIPTYENGITSGAAAFYDGALYLGIEGYNSGSATGRKSVLWRIDFDGSLNTTQSSQVYGSNADAGSSTIHDWSDVVINNGILYDFDGAASDEDIYHYNLQTGDSTRFAPGSTPRQVAVNWAGQVYNVSNTIAAYNYNGTMGTAYTISSTPAIPGGGSWGDAAEAFRPLMDFGDAPTSYEGVDPTWGVSAHERDTALRLGTAVSIEWVKRGNSAPATDDSNDDGMPFTPILAPGPGSYVATTVVTNNTSSAATLLAWLDYNGNGIFDATEAITPINVPAGTQGQSYNLFWPNKNNSFVNGQFTYLRIRLTSASNGMTASNATGYFSNGEVEDYRVLVDNFLLKVNLLNFTAKAINKNNVALDWESSEEENFIGFELQRSADNYNWETLNTFFAKGNGTQTLNKYSFNDFSPLPGKSFYRLKLINGDGKNRLSEIRNITINSIIEKFIVSPIPASDKINISFKATQSSFADISIADLSGKIVYALKHSVVNGENRIEVPVSKVGNSGFYVLYIRTNNELFNRKIVVNKK